MQDEALLGRMTDLIAHRGPDTEGHYLSPPVGLGHRPFSIIDLSERAGQPLFSEYDHRVIIQNGEVYNVRKFDMNSNGMGSPFF